MQNESGDQRAAASKRATLASIIVNIFLSIGQVLLGIIGNSQALIADGIHTLSDLSTDALVLYAIWHGNKEADADHPYGHGRIETAATLNVTEGEIIGQGRIQSASEAVALLEHTWEFH